jgi:uncharacterized phage-like protein YoqJ
MINYYQGVALLTDLKKNYPTYNMGKHIATAFADYTDVWGLSDKVFYSTLLNVIELELMFLIRR